MRRTLTVLFLVGLSAAWSHAANVSIPTFQLLTRGLLDDGLFVLSTQADVEVKVGGGYKFGGELNLSIRSDTLEEPTNPTSVYDQGVVAAALRERLTLSSASAIVRDLFGLPFDLRYFIGEHDRILNGDLFPEHFGTPIIASDFRGLLYFPDGLVYDGVHVVDGTGLALSAARLAPWLFLETAVYQDAYLGAGYYSSDLRAAFNFQRFKAETFVGASFPQAEFGIYRAGALLYYATGEGGEFLTQIGVPRWAPVTDGALTMNDFFFLFEPRVHIGLVSLVLTLFWHPEYYVQAPTNESFATDIVVRVIAGDLTENAVSGGLESAVRLRPSEVGDQQQLRVGAAPFLSINSSGVLWDFKADFNLFPFDLTDLVTGYVGIRTQF